jgi:hypothetical protein
LRAELEAGEPEAARERELSNRRVPAEATVLAAGTLLRVAPESAHAGAARRVLLAAIGSRKTTVRGLAVEQLGALGPAGAWAQAPLEKLARSGKGGEVLEQIAAALRAIEGKDLEGKDLEGKDLERADGAAAGGDPEPG